MATKTKKSNSTQKKKPITKKATKKTKSVVKKAKAAPKKKAKTKVATKKKTVTKATAKKKTVAKAASKKKTVAKAASKKKTVAKAASKKKTVAKAATKKKTVAKAATKKKTATKATTKMEVKINAKKSAEKTKTTASNQTESKTRKTKNVATISNTPNQTDKKTAEKPIGKKTAVKKKKRIKEINYDDLQINENANSVAGPLEFTPYTNVAEEYMSDQQLQHFELILNNWREQLMADVDTTVGHLQKDGIAYADPLDRAAQEEGFNLELRTRDRERKLLKKIEQALDWISEGSYGFCEDCGAEIGIRRLEARPTAAKCIDCKTFSEIREKQIGR